MFNKNNENNENDRSLKSVVNKDSSKTGKVEACKDGSHEKSAIKPGLKVHAKVTGEIQGTTGKYVGKVDCLHGDSYIKLTKEDSSDKQHKWIPTSWVARTDDKGVYLNKTEAEFQAAAFKSEPKEMQDEEIMNKAV